MIYSIQPSKWLSLLIFFYCGILFANHEATEPTDGTVNSFRWFSPPRHLGEVSLYDGDNKPLSLSQFKNKIVLLNLWASWCPPCIRELPALDQLQQRLGGDDFIVVTIALDKDPSLARQMFNERLKLKHLTLFLEPTGKLGSHFPVDVLPSNFFINRKAQAIGMLRSYVDWSDPQADILIKRLIDGVDTKTLSSEKKLRDKK